jgi:hypothetical protein
MTLPGIWLQNLTTREPSDDQLEVAIYALKESLKLEPKEQLQTVLKFGGWWLVVGFGPPTSHQPPTTSLCLRNSKPSKKLTKN